MALNLAHFYDTDPAGILLVFAMIGLRATVALGLLPLLSKDTVPRVVVGGLSMALALPPVAAHLSSGRPLPVELAFGPLLLYALKEGSIGLVIGWGFGAFFASLQSIGQYIDHQTGLTFTQNVDHQNGNSVSTTAQFLERVLFSVLLCAGALLAIVDALYLSYQVWPPGQWTPVFDHQLPLAAAGQAGKLFALSLLLSGPVLLMLFIVDACLGMLNRAAPTLNVSGITMGIKPMVSLLVLVMALPMLVDRSSEALRLVGQTLKLFLLSGPTG